MTHGRGALMPDGAAPFAPSIASTSGRHALEPEAAAAPALNSVFSTIGTPESIVSPTPHSNFMDLPVELRLQVYRELVVVGKIFYSPERCSSECSTRLNGYKVYSKPSLTILRVSKIIHREAEDLYLSQNLFVLPSDFGERYPLARRKGLKRRFLFSVNGLRQIKHVSIEISSQNTKHHTPNRAYWNNIEFCNPGFFDGMTAEQGLKQAHKTALRSYDVSFYDSNHRIRRLGSLQTIELDFTNAYCPVGCCRMVEMRDAFTPSIFRVQRIRMLGLRHRVEEEKLLTDWTAEAESFSAVYEEHEKYWLPEKRWSVADLHKRYNITFGTKDDPWEQWKMNNEDA